MLLAWLWSVVLSRRVQRDCGRGEAIQRRQPDPAPPYNYGSDELGAVARVLDSSVPELGRRLGELSRGRARMEAILGGMVEGVLVLGRPGGCRWSTRRAGDARRRRPASDGAMSNDPASGHRRPARGGAPGKSREEGTPSRTRHLPMFVARAARLAAATAARCWCCTTSPICRRADRSGATSSPTCRTSCVRRSRRSAATSRR